MDMSKPLTELGMFLKIPYSISFHVIGMMMSTWNHPHMAQHVSWFSLSELL